MWKLVARGARGTPFNELGQFASITEAAEVIAKRENEQGFVFFRVSADIWREKPESDAEILSCLEYQSPTHYYALTREAN